MDEVKGPPNLIPDNQCLAISQRNQLHSPLLRLPAEIRNKVYFYTLELTTGEYAQLHTSHYTWDRLSFVRSSRQIFAETAAAYFKLKLLPLRYKTLGISFIPHKPGRVLPLTLSQFQMLNAIAMEWDTTVGLSPGDYCPFTHVGGETLDHLAGTYR